MENEVITIDCCLINLHEMDYQFGVRYWNYWSIFPPWTTKTETTLADMLWNISWEAKKTKQGKQLPGESLLAQMYWQDSKKRKATAASAVCSADFCAELFPSSD